MAVANAAAIESVNKRVFNMERKYNGLTNKCRRLTELCESQDTYSRRENLLIRGVDKGNNIRYLFQAHIIAHR